MKKPIVWVPLVAALAGLIWLLGTMRPMSNPKNGMNLAKFAALPVLDEGRFKPIDTYARLNMMAINRRQVYYDAADNRHQAVKWLLDSLAWGYSQEQIKAPRLDVFDPDVLEFLGVETKRRDGRYVFRELIADEKVLAKFEAIEKKKEAERSPIEKKVVGVVHSAQSERQALRQEIIKYQSKNGSPLQARVFRIDNDQVLNLLELEWRSGLRYSYSEVTGLPDDPESLSDPAKAAARKLALEQMQRFDKLHEGAIEASRRPENKRDLADHKSMELVTSLRTWEELAMMPVEMRGPARAAPPPGMPIIPPAAGPESGAWVSLRESLTRYEARNNPDADRMEKIIEAYATGNTKAFNTHLDAYHKSLESSMSPGILRRVRLEAWFNNFAPFYQCALLYVVVLLLAVLSWVVWHEPLRRAAFWLAVVVWIAHTLSLVMRMYLTQRPPVIDLYSSAVFIGWGAVLVCLWLERVVAQKNPFANSIGVTVAALLGFATMIVAHHLGGSGDTMPVLQAVLDTNFWLATHVTIVTLGYTATFVGGFLALFFVFRMLATAVRSFFAENKPIVGKDAVYFVAAAAGLWTMIGLLVIGLCSGLYVLAQDEPPDGLVLTMMCLIAGVGIGIGTVATTARRLSGEVLPNLPPMAQFADQFALNANAGKVLTSLVYGVLCFATLLSFVGTVLGGIWADQSWGRFWGWDPKENGALLIVIMNALILHARWSGMIRERGMCALAILGNMVTAWSWFGTNQLGVGLHAYGFNKSLAFGCAVFWVSQLILVCFSFLPLRLWRAYAEQPLPKPTGPTPGQRQSAGRGTNIQPA